jgi:uncharacterized phage protein gp47/JayE
MRLQLQNFSSLVGTAAAAVQGAASALLDLTVGSTLRAVLEASASVALWLQWLIVQVLQTTRAATSQGADLDSFVADFGVARLPAVAAVGQVTFARYTPSAAAVVPVGTQVRTSDGTQSFLVTADSTNPAWSASQNGYAIAAGVASVTVAAVAQVAAAAGNVQPGTLTLISAAIPGVDTVTNAAGFTGGMDPETDAALRVRFASFFPSLARATPAALGWAVGSVQQGLQYAVQENVLPNGTAQMGSFVLTVNDGTGAPSSSLIAAVGAAVEAYRPVGAVYAVMAPTVTTANVTLTIAQAPGAANAIGAVAAAITAYIQGLGLGAPLSWSRLFQVAYDASPGVTGVSGLLVNGGTADIAVAAGGVVMPGSIVVS